MGFWLVLTGLLKNSRKAWLPYFCRSGQREASLEEFNEKVVGWLFLLPEIEMPPLTGDAFFQVVRRKTATAGSLDGWGWRELKSLPVPWFDGLARILAEVEDLGVWPEGLLDAFIAMIPKVGGDSTPLGQRHLSVLPVVYRISASARMQQLEGWFQSWVLSSVYGTAVRAEMRGWVLSDEGHKWTVKLQARDSGCHLDTTLREWSSTLSLWVRLVTSLHLAFWMGHMVVILLFVLSGFGSGFFVGACPLGLKRFLGCTDFLILFVMSALVMVLFMLWLRVLAVLVFLGTLF